MILNFENSIIDHYTHRQTKFKKRYLPILQNNIVSSNILKLHLSSIFLSYCNKNELSNYTLFDFGCGNGIKDLIFLELGFNPQNIFCFELHPELYLKAKSILPTSINLINKSIISFSESNELLFDIGFQSMALSSLTDKDYFKQTCNSISKHIKKDGLFISYDFIIKKPGNELVIPMTKKLLCSSLNSFDLISEKSLTLLPQLSRTLNSLSPLLHEFLERIYILNTHRLLVFRKK